MTNVVPFRLSLPATRGDCEDGPRPCPHTRCLHHLIDDTNVNPSGNGRARRMLPVLADMAETCALDVADRGGETLEEVGRILGVTRERIRQIEAIALRKVRARADAMKRDETPEAWRDVGLNIG